MIVELINKQTYAVNNQDYIGYINGLAESIFQAEKLGPSGYIQSNLDNFRQTRHKHIAQTPGMFKVLPSVSEKPVFIHKCISTEDLGPYENAVLSNILNSEYSTIVITGALGSGKSTIINFILEYLSDNIIHKNCNNHTLCKSHDTIYIRINFIKGFNSVDTKDILEEFDAKLYDSFTHVIRLLFNDDELLESFIKYATSYNETLLIPFKFLGLKIKQTDNWGSFETIEKLELILDWLHNRFGSEFALSYKNSVLAEMINFIGIRFPERLNGCFIILFDNVDRFKDEVQNEVINRLLGVSQIINAKTIICSRLTTFGKISGNSSYAFGVIENAGHLPVSVIIERIKHYIENVNVYEKYISARSVIPEKYLNAFDNRINEIYRLLTNKRYSRLYESIDALSGLSIRRGLHLAKRLITNSVSDYSTVPEEDMLISGILCKNNENAQMAYDDRRITNIFLSHYSLKNSLINIRILGILYIYKTNNRPIRISELLYYLNLYGISSKEEIYYSVNTLISVRKRLIYINGVSDLNEIQLFEDREIRNSLIQLTWAGQKYYTSLCENLQYLQDCFAIINWSKLQMNGNIELITNYLEEKKFEFTNDPQISSSTLAFLKRSLIENNTGDISEIIPKSIDYSNFYERIKFIRKGLYIYLYKDVYQSILYQKNVFDPNNLYKNNTLIFINQLSTIDLISMISKSVYRISKSNFLQDKQVYDELLNWKSLLRLSHYWNYTIFHTNSSLSQNVLKEYDSL